ncbi:defense protein Hdd11 [Biomphalaria pfeifferi]|uniref:Defense protein Hdd11 n=1 Tax=Biomphalaria pfeifferi TaxID=112525 RepID=A0AAD8BYL3_BIOPF|nr:defense protein Hdd11 [Biomphalaria pfeifferi]
MSFKPGQGIAVTLKSFSAGFTGFMIQAKRSDASQSQEMLGTFSVVSNTRLACSGKALVHSNDVEKSSLMFNWIAPDTPVGNIHFRVTFVQSLTIFWSNKVSRVLVQKSLAINSTLSFASNCSMMPTKNVCLWLVTIILFVYTLYYFE